MKINILKGYGLEKVHTLNEKYEPVKQNEWGIPGDCKRITTSGIPNQRIHDEIEEMLTELYEENNYTVHSTSPLIFKKRVNGYQFKLTEYPAYEKNNTHIQYWYVFSLVKNLK